MKDGFIPVCQGGLRLANFHTHISVSTLAGATYGTAGVVYGDMPLETGILAGGLCAVSGMLPDLDSDNSVPVREMLCFGAAAIPMLLSERFQSINLSHEELIIVGAVLYAAIRLGIGELLKRFTVHRGMFHSIPALLIAMTMGYLLCHFGDVGMRIFKAGGIGIGFLSHLILDEVWAVRWTMLGPRTKKSFGTAMKFYGDNAFANSITYAALFLVGVLAYQDLSQPPSAMPVIVKERGSLVERLSEAWNDSVRR
jgi:membrane-bound metal-dependent hydrolase YbcI (DUF457 family)